MGSGITFRRLLAGRLSPLIPVGRQNAHGVATVDGLQFLRCEHAIAGQTQSGEIRTKHDL